MPKGPLAVLRFSAASSHEIQDAVIRIRNVKSSVLNQEILQTTSKILGEVKKSGDRALIKFGRKFDSPRINKANLLVTRSEIDDAYSKLEKSQISAMKKAYNQIVWLAEEQIKRFGERKFKTPLGYEILERYEPFRRIGGYVPGGLASYPSTVLMICGPARVAGVKEIVLATPPRKDGRVSESTLVAADVCGVSEIFKTGGAQAIGALAYGTDTVGKVDLIAGPGNAYVTEAKRQVAASGDVLIDSLAGPTELLILADKSANPDYVVEDLISQAEHGNRTLCGVASDSKDLLDSVERKISSILVRNRMDHIKNAVLFAVKVRSLNQVVEFGQKFAPEHLESMLGPGYSKLLTNSGLVLVGDYTPCSSTDYIVGTNHILPTGGTARTSSGLAVENFLKRVTLVKGSKDSLSRSSGYIATLATMEGLSNHASAALSRFGGESG